MCSGTAVLDFTPRTGVCDTGTAATAVAKLFGEGRTPENRMCCTCTARFENADLVHLSLQGTRVVTSEHKCFETVTLSLKRGLLALLAPHRTGP